MLANQSSQPKKILLAVDGSEHSLAAAQFVHDLPLPLGSRICILSVLIPREAGLKTYALEHFMERVSQMLQDKGAEISTCLIAGNPATEIVREAKEVGTDVIVMGAKGLRATLGILLGGVAQQVVEHAGEPVMVIRAPYVGMRNILLVVDGSSQSMEAVNYLAQFPFSQEAEVQVLHILPPMPSTDALAQAFPGVTEGVYYPMPEDLDALNRLAEEEQEEGEALLKNIQQQLEKSGIFAQTILLRGDAATEIIEYTKRHQMDLVVAGSRGLGGFEGWVLGSVSRKLVHYAGCSVLIVKS
ncbi:MAG: universal stress protein [Anaerolineales bacterium]|nr:universal stress protein [Anaerolineales bacterium]